MVRVSGFAAAALLCAACGSNIDFGKIDRALAGSPDAATQALATKLAAGLTAAEGTALRNLDWSATTARSVLKNAAVLHALTIAQANPAVRPDRASSLTAASRPGDLALPKGGQCSRLDAGYAGFRDKVVDLLREKISRKTCPAGEQPGWICTAAVLSVMVANAEDIFHATLDRSKALAECCDNGTCSDESNEGDGCGQANGKCCESTPACQSGAECIAGTCSPCGQKGQRCCSATPKCASMTACKDLSCVECGNKGQPCCERNNLLPTGCFGKYICDPAATNPTCQEDVCGAYGDWTLTLGAWTCGSCNQPSSTVNAFIKFNDAINGGTWTVGDLTWKFTPAGCKLTGSVSRTSCALSDPALVMTIAAGTNTGSGTSQVRCCSTGGAGTCSQTVSGTKR